MHGDAGSGTVVEWRLGPDRWSIVSDDATGEVCHVRTDALKETA